MFLPENVEIVDCQPECNGTGNRCLAELKQVVDSGKVAFMLRADHVKSVADELGYQVIEVEPRDNLPAGIFIYKNEKR